MNVPYVVIAEWVVRIGMALVIVLRRRAAAVALAWLVVVAFIPFAGAVAYFFFGEIRLGKRRSKRHAAVRRTIDVSGHSRERIGSVFQPHVAHTFRTVAALAEGLGGGQPLGGNELTLLSHTDQMIERLIDDVEASRSHCHMLYYIFNDDASGRAVAEALMRAATRGVACRVIVDAVGSRDFLAGDLPAALRDRGVEVAEMMPVNPLRAALARMDLRSHRKLAIIDGHVAYLGSHNLSGQMYPSKARYGAWVDASVRLTGPAVYGLQELFVQDWCFATDDAPHDDLLFPSPEGFMAGPSTVQVLPTGPDAADMPLADVILQALRVATRRVVFTTPYFVPDEAILVAMRAAARRGVEVVLVVPERSDHALTQAAGRSSYGYLLDAGVQIHLFQGGLLHAKTLCVDEGFAMIGSANLDVRSFLLNFELSLLIYDPNFASELRYLQAHYLQQSRRLARREWSKRGVTTVLADNLAKLATPLL